MIRLDVYTCSVCGEGFTVEEDKQPVSCPLCGSADFEFSHTMIGANVDDEDILHLGEYVEYWLNIEDEEYMQPRIRRLFLEIKEEVFRIEAKRYAADPANWGASCKWPYEDDLPF
ncbi:hypothetical protein [Parageobacillus thermoglucosidasius]|uniref:hypothetical protein n=1 Tax=Parageobacillus thermoglucosidasius TaxID=1426 RepID=UPI0001D17A74|nr:hypothetical protein [Parageobacillus thermoglucosidasius]AEH47112.1 putative protein, contains Zn-ribbon domain [Parageobacillus thermoglucosidasius C56-YS93]